MDMSGVFKIKEWWMIVLFFGILFFFIAITTPIFVVNSKHIIGISIGMILVGISNLIAIHTVIHKTDYYIFKTTKPIHNKLTLSIHIIGIFLIILFLLLIIFDLFKQ